MIDSFRSEQGGGDHSSKRVSWSIERHRGRAASVGQAIRLPLPNALDNIPDGFPFSQSADAHPELSLHPNQDLNETTSPVISSRGFRASRKGSTMVFLSVWALFGFGTLVHQRTTLTSNVTEVGQVLASTSIHNSIPIAFDDHGSLLSREDMNPAALRLESAHLFLEDKEHKFPVDPHEDPHEDPSSEQVLGRIFAWLCTTLYLTSRLPQIWKNVSHCVTT